MNPGEPPEPPAAPDERPTVNPSRVRTTRWAAAIVTPLIVLLAALGLDAVDQAAPETLGGAAQRFVPPDGHRTVVEDAAGAITVAEHSRSVGIEGLLTAPPIVAEALLRRLGEEDARTAQWWRVTRTMIGGERTTDLYRLSSNGISQVASWGGAVGFVFDPDLLLMPSDARPGDGWTASGSALADGALVYEARSQAFSASGPFTDRGGNAVPLTGGCLGVDASIRIASTVDDLATTLTEQTVWCPGRGPVWSVGSIDGQSVGQAEIRPPFVGGVEAPRPVGDEPPSTTSWQAASSTAARLGPFRQERLIAVDPFFGESEVAAQFGVPAAVLPDGRYVTANDRGDDLQWWRLDGSSRAVLDAVGHPGGTIIALAAVGETIVTTTEQRAIVAYDARGRRLWQWRGTELVLAAPLVVPGATGDQVLAVDRGGQVTLLDVATGVEQWSGGLGADARTAPVLAGAAVVIGDERGRVTALAIGDGSVLWQVELGLVNRIAASPDGTAVAAALTTGSIVVLDAAVGSSQWSARMPGNARGLIASDDSLIALSDERLAAFTLRDGVERWRANGAETIAGGGELIITVSDGAVQLIAVNDGALLDEQSVGPVSVGASRSVALIGTDLLLIDSDGLVQRGGLR